MTCFGVFVDAFEDDARDDLALAVLCDRTLAKLVADLDARDIADADRRPAARIENDVLDVVDVLNQPEAANDVLLIAVLDKIRTGVLVVVLDRVEKRS